MASNQDINDELGDWMAVVVAWTTAYPDICLKEPGKSPKRLIKLTGVPAGFRNEHLRNTSLDRYRYANAAHMESAIDVLLHYVGFCLHIVT
jgi:hypothetical protein